MRQELVKPVVKVGNGAGVVLPREWYGGLAKVELVETPVNIKKDIFEILGRYLDQILGIYVVGSYARNQQTEDSDVDILAVTSELNKRIVSGKYEILLISRDNLEETLKKNILPLLPMLKESKTVLNGELVENYKKTSLTKKNLNWHIETTKSAIKLNESFVSDCRDDRENCGDEVSYSLILRLREVYIVDCLINNKKWSTKELKSLIKKVSGSMRAYEGYVRSKKNKKSKKNLEVEEAGKIIKYIGKRIEWQEKWLTKRG